MHTFSGTPTVREYVHDLYMCGCVLCTRVEGDTGRGHLYVGTRCQVYTYVVYVVRVLYTCILGFKWTCVSVYVLVCSVFRAQ